MVKQLLWCKNGLYVVWRLYLPDSTSFSIRFNIEASQQPKESVGGKELKPKWQ